MEFWFSELHSPHVKFDIRVEKQLFSGKSDYQRIDVFESPEFGKFLTLNGSVIFSEQDCFIYNEMVVHVPMAVHPDVKNVLIIGGGGGGGGEGKRGK
ncbi:spermidine synthase [Eubacterium sp. CAG:86]|nr:spermidine synthase [Eubacterium sp. CAG:86]